MPRGDIGSVVATERGVKDTVFGMQISTAELRELLTLLRENGVIQFKSAGVEVVLGPEPSLEIPKETSSPTKRNWRDMPDDDIRDLGLAD